MIGEKIKNGAENFAAGVKKAGKRNLVICASVLIIAVAVCINWALLSGGSLTDDQLPTGSDGTGEGNGTVDAGNSDNENVASYFASVQISRQQARDEALEVLQMVIASESAMENAKNEAIESVNRIADEIAAEANIETLVKAKGFAECVTVISEDSVSVIVQKDELQAVDTAQILTIVYETTGISPDKVSIINKA
jgi:stage III sporulation protein AH